MAGCCEHRHELSGFLKCAKSSRLAEGPSASREELCAPWRYLFGCSVNCFTPRSPDHSGQRIRQYLVTMEHNTVIKHPLFTVSSAWSSVYGVGRGKEKTLLAKLRDQLRAALCRIATPLTDMSPRRGECPCSLELLRKTRTYITEICKYYSTKLLQLQRLILLNYMIDISCAGILWMVFKVHQ